MDEKEYILAFEGTHTAGDWVADVVWFFDSPHNLFEQMNTEITAWLGELKIDTIHALVGHSAGDMFVKNVFSQSELEKYGTPWQISFNGYDKSHSMGPRMIDIRDQGDVVSACFGAESPVLVCSSDAKSIGDTHLLPSFELENVTWDIINAKADNRFELSTAAPPPPPPSPCPKKIWWQPWTWGCKKSSRVDAASPDLSALNKCNQKVLDPSNDATDPENSKNKDRALLCPDTVLEHSNLGDQLLHQLEKISGAVNSWVSKAEDGVKNFWSKITGWFK